MTLVLIHVVVHILNLSFTLSDFDCPSLIRHSSHLKHPAKILSVVAKAILLDLVH